MTAERPGREPSLGEDGLTAGASLANAGTPAVTLCPGFYLVKPRHAYGEAFADCDRCGVTGKAGYRCSQTVISE
jgi:hypothetical protein